MKHYSLDSVKETIVYALYPPTFFFGPIILFSDWCSWRKSQLKIPIPSDIVVCSDFEGCLSKRKLSLGILAWRAVRLCIWFLFWEAVLHIFYPNALIFSLTQSAMNVPPPHLVNNSDTFHASTLITTDRPAPGMAVYLLGLQFYFTYLLLYGWPRWISDLEVMLTSWANGEDASGIQRNFVCVVPDGPQCFSHMFLFSDIWRYAIGSHVLSNYMSWFRILISYA